MKSIKPYLPLLVIGGYSLLFILGISLSIGPRERAAADYLQVSPLPTRITPTPSPTPLPATVTPPAEESGNDPAGYIELNLVGFERPDTLWTELEWYSANGNWYTIQDGWQGHPETDGKVRWLVGEELLGSDTLFRWRIYSAEEGRLLQRSTIFKLPEHSGRTQTVVVEK